MTSVCWSLDGQRWQGGHADDDDAIAAALEHEASEGDGLDDGGALLVWLGHADVDVGASRQLPPYRVDARRELFVDLARPELRLSAPRILSIHQPWAWLILEGGKDVENRPMRTAYRGPLLIHAAKAWVRRKQVEALDSVARLGLREREALPSLDELEAQCGTIIGQVELVDCVAARDSTSAWATADWAWVLARPRRLARPIAWKGMLGLLHCPLEVARQVELADEGSAP